MSAANPNESLMDARNVSGSLVLTANLLLLQVAFQRVPGGLDVKAAELDRFIHRAALAELEQLGVLLMRAFHGLGKQNLHARIAVGFVV